MSESILLSVIVPVYNLEPFLPETLDSLLRIRLDAPYEILAADDGSSDGSREVLESWAEKHTNLRILTGPNGGVSRARNKGIHAAKGKYLTFADGDDAVDPDFFAEAIREMEAGGYDIVQGHTRYLDGKEIKMILPGSGLIPGGRISVSDPEELMELFFGRTETLMFSSCAKVFRRETIGETRFPPGIRVAEDQRFMFGLLRRGPKVLILDRNAYDYNMRDSSVTHADYAEKGWDAIKVLEECEKEATADGLSPAILRHIQKRKTDVWVRIYNTAVLTGKDPSKALDAIRKADLSAVRENLTKKEAAKLALLQKCAPAYNGLLRFVK